MKKKKLILKKLTIAKLNNPYAIYGGAGGGQVTAACNTEAAQTCVTQHDTRGSTAACAAAAGFSNACP